jgi:lipoyl(octanoyl) transferase
MSLLVLLLTLLLVLQMPFGFIHLSTGFVVVSTLPSTKVTVQPGQFAQANIRHVMSIMISPQQLGTFEVLENMATKQEERKVILMDFTTSSDRIDFETAWDFQKDLMNHHLQRLESEGICSTTTTTTKTTTTNSFWKKTNQKVSGCDTVIMLQHHPVYTLGTGSDVKYVLQEEEPGAVVVPVIRMDRGGEVTYHGPGQLTVYPVLDLRSYRQDIHWYMRALEEAIILALFKCDLQHPATRQDGVTGVWVDNHKVAAVGIKCRKWITMHGLAVNVEHESLSKFEGIVPCGLEGRQVGCINQFIDKPMTVHDFAEIMKEALEEVFQIQLIERGTK